MRPHTEAEAARVLDTVGEWQRIFRRALGRRMVFAADEYYLLAGPRPAPGGALRGLSPARERHRHGPRLRRRPSLARAVAAPGGVRHGFFASVDAAPAEGYRAPRLPTVPAGHDSRPVTVLTGTYGARVLGPLLASHPRPDLEVRAVPNDFFGGNIGVAGLMTGEDVARALASIPAASRCLLPDACLNEGRFLDGLTLADLPRPVEVVPTDGRSLRAALDGTSFRPTCAA